MPLVDPGMLTLDGAPSHHYWEAQRINSAVVALGPTLMQLRSTNTTFVRASPLPKTLSGPQVVLGPNPVQNPLGLSTCA